MSPEQMHVCKILWWIFWLHGCKSFTRGQDVSGTGLETSLSATGICFTMGQWLLCLVWLLVTADALDEHEHEHTPRGRS
jgi:hypothetical protein